MRRPRSAFSRNKPTTGAALAKKEKTCPGCSATFVPVPPSRVYCRPVCGARHQLRGQRELPLLDPLVTELPTPRFVQKKNSPSGAVRLSMPRELSHGPRGALGCFTRGA